MGSLPCLPARSCFCARRRVPESFAPVCLPTLCPSAFHYAHISYVTPEICVTLISSNPHSFTDLKAVRCAASLPSFIRSANACRGRSLEKLLCHGPDSCQNPPPKKKRKILRPCKCFTMDSSFTLLKIMEVLLLLRLVCCREDFCNTLASSGALADLSAAARQPQLSLRELLPHLDPLNAASGTVGAPLAATRPRAPPGVSFSAGQQAYAALSAFQELPTPEPVQMGPGMGCDIIPMGADVSPEKMTSAGSDDQQGPLGRISQRWRGDLVGGQRRTEGGECHTGARTGEPE